MSLAQVLGLAFRPKALDKLVGQKKLVKQIRGHFEQGRIPQAWMFVGETGAGKTTIARILALTLQCRHQTRIGNPCPRCQKDYDRFDIVEINASHIRRVEDLERALEGYNYEPKPGSKNRVYVLDEAQMLSRHSQNLLLKFLEDCPKTTYWIICTTDPQRIIKTVQSRCTATYAVPGQSQKSTRRLVRRAMLHIHCQKDRGELCDALLEGNVSSPRRILSAVERYSAGANAEDAAKVEISTDIDTYRICRALIKGAWRDIAAALEDAKPEDMHVVRAAVSNYLNGILLAEDDFSRRTQVVSESIQKLVALEVVAESQQLPGLCAVLYDLCKTFSKYQH